MLPVGKGLDVLSARLSLLQTETKLPEGPAGETEKPIAANAEYRKRELNKAEPCMMTN